MAGSDDLFIDEEGQPPRKRASEQPESAEPPTADFDPFANVDVDVNAPEKEAATIEGGDAPPVDAGDAPEPEPLQSRLQAGPGVAAGGGSIDPGQDSGSKDILPERAENLWPCPHCGARNKPERERCRHCDKSPDEEVVVPVSEQPWFKPAVAGAIVVLLVGLLTFSCSML